MESDEDTEILEDLFLVKYMYDKLGKRRGNRKLFQTRDEFGFYNTGLNILTAENDELFEKSIRMHKTMFNVLLNLIGPFLQKFSHRKALEPKHRLYITLYFLAHGCSLHTLCMKFRAGLETVRAIILETCDVIWNKLKQFYVSQPSEQDWAEIARGFFKDTGLPNCVGALDGKHIRIKAPSNSGSQFYNYKKYNSIVLMAICDSNYIFTLVDVGNYGSISDGGVLRHASFGKRLLEGTLNFPQPTRLPGSSTYFPYYVVADAAFPLKPNIMKPYAKVVNSKTVKYNKIISKARVRIEMAFGIMASKWRVLQTAINFSPENTKKIVLACVVLHNFLRFAKSKSALELDLMSNLISVDREEMNTSRNSTQFALENRNILCDYLSNSEIEYNYV